MAISLDTSQSSYGVCQTPPPPGGPGAQGLQTLATDLGVSTTDLQTARASGQSLADFAQSKGISRDTLVSAVKDSFTANAPAGAAAPSDDQLTAMATQMIDRKPGAGGHHHHHHGGGAAQGVQMPDSSILSALTGTSSTDGTSPTDTTLAQLLQNLTSSDSSTTGDSTDSSLQQLLQQLTDSSSSYGSDGGTPAPSGSLGLSALV